MDTLTAAAFLIPALPISLWVAWSDLSAMRIPNKAVLALFFAFAAVGPFVLPLEEYAWRYAHVAVVLVAGFFLNTFTRGFGAGDAKFMAAMAAYVDLASALIFIQILCVMCLVAVALHRLARAMPWVKRSFPDWKSWTHPKFPLGVALAASLVIYLAVGLGPLY